MSDTPGSAEPQLRINNEWRSRGYLPHRDRIGLMQSITFRLADSLPKDKLREMEEGMERMKMKDEEAELGLRDPGKEKEAELGLRDPRVHASRVWMPDYWDRYIRDEIHLRSVIDYLHNNPVKAGLCRKETDWPWSSAYADNNKMYE